MKSSTSMHLRYSIGRIVPIVLLTHEASEQAIGEALQEIGQFEFVRENYLRLRIF